MQYQIMSDSTKSTFGVFRGETPDQALDAWFSSVNGLPYRRGVFRDHCHGIGLPYTYRVDGFRIYV